MWTMERRLRLNGVSILVIDTQSLVPVDLAVPTQRISLSVLLTGMMIHTHALQRSLEETMSLRLLIMKMSLSL